MAEIEQPAGTQDHESDQIHYRLEQQRFLAEFGTAALRSTSIEEILDCAAEFASKGMRSRFSKLLRYREKTGDLLLVAGVGWDDGVVGHMTLLHDDASPAGYAFNHDSSVISNHLSEEDRFRTPKFMSDHGIERAINILIKVKDRKWGVLEVDSKHDGQFSKDDLAFMQALADLVGVAIGRQEKEERLTQEARYQTMLNREASHRVKNSLALITSMLQLQSNGADANTARALKKAQDRIGTIANAHDLLWQSDKLGSVEIGEMICKVSENLEEEGRVSCEASNLPNITVPAEIAIPIGIIVNELVTNAIKYAYPVGEGTVYIEAFDEKTLYRVIICDHGRGMPEDFTLEGSHHGSLGMRLISALVRQLKADIRFEDNSPGTRVVLEVPIGDRTSATVAEQSA
ncbi:histidine kinase dimerization/phosphoacceptor domain -containing protein [Sphingomicrobium sp. XHP0239]|uniref:sensor histidine kinase n=1 Tax=Sphingomicrobium maritimum TaxID=3133972 RepID=UPI0031CCBBB5